MHKVCTTYHNSRQTTAHDDEDEAFIAYEVLQLTKTAPLMAIERIELQVIGLAERIIDRPRVDVSLVLLHVQKKAASFAYGGVWSAQVL